MRMKIKEVGSSKLDAAVMARAEVRVAGWGWPHAYECVAGDIEGLNFR
jgi:hypothetical protein